MERQEIYAKWLEWGTRAGLAMLVASFFAYALGLFEALVPPAGLARLWKLPLGEYLAATGAPTGWDWLQFLGWSDYVNFVGIGALALVTVACYARMIPVLLARGERLHAWLAFVQVLVLLAAASGLLSGGH